MAKYQKYNSRRVRRFLRAAFPAPETEGLIEFFQDYDYDELLASLGSRMSHKQMINALFNHCHNDKALEKLLSSAREILEDEGKKDILKDFSELFPPTEESSNNEEEQRFFDALLQLNYRQEVSMFNDFLGTQRPISFLIRGPKRHGQRLLLNQLYRCLLYSTSNKRIERSLLRHGGSCRINFLWYELAQEVGVKIERSPQAIARQIHDCLQSQHVILIFKEAGYTHKGYLSQLIREFWHPLVDELTRIDPLRARTYQLIMFIIDYQGQADLGGVDWIDKFHTHSTPHCPVKLELSAFSEEDVRGWFKHNASRVLPSESRKNLEKKINEIFKNKTTGLMPQQILKEICDCCGYDWIEGEDKWFKL